MKIAFSLRAVCGRPLYYPNNNLADTLVTRICGRRTVDRETVSQLRDAGFEIEITDETGAPVSPERREELIQKIKRHDWSFDYSEDIRIVREGAAERAELFRMFGELTGHEREYFLALVPAGWQEEFRRGLSIHLGEAK